MLYYPTNTITMVWYLLHLMSFTMVVHHGVVPMSYHPHVTTTLHHDTSDVITSYSLAMLCMSFTITIGGGDDVAPHYSLLPPNLCDVLYPILSHHHGYGRWCYRITTNP